MNPRQEGMAVGDTLRYPFDTLLGTMGITFLICHYSEIACGNTLDTHFLREFYREGEGRGIHESKQYRPKGIKGIACNVTSGKFTINSLIPIEDTHLQRVSKGIGS